jgi:hypothetical protein
MRLHQSNLFSMHYYHLLLNYYIKNNGGFFKTTTLEPLSKKPDLSKIRFLKYRLLLKKRHGTKNQALFHKKIDF